jgi:hypothetical protein
MAAEVMATATIRLKEALESVETLSLVAFSRVGTAGEIGGSSLDVPRSPRELALVHHDRRE